MTQLYVSIAIYIAVVAMNISIIVQHVRVLLHGHLFSLKIIPWDISPVFRNAGWDISRILRVEHAITAIKNALLAI